MIEESIKLTKLACGDLIISKVLSDSMVYIVEDPLQIMYVPGQHGMRQILMPWIEGSATRVFDIAPHTIITKTDPQREVIDAYMNVVNARRFSDLEEELVPPSIKQNINNNMH